VETSELLKKVRKIEIRTKGLTKQVFAGEYHSAFKGKGMAFSEVREYQYGDDIRAIDWNVTARFNHPYVKIFEEERELTVMLLIDVSFSNIFGSQGKKSEMIALISSVLAFSAIQNNDKVGVIFFSDKEEKYIPPKKGKKHILRIISDLLTFIEKIEVEQNQKKVSNTDIAQVLQKFTNAVKRRSTCFLITDLLDFNGSRNTVNYTKALQIARYKHDIVCLQIYDKRDYELPNMGMVEFVDPETNERRIVDTSDKKTRKHYANWRREYDKQQERLAFAKFGVDLKRIGTHDKWEKEMMELFKRRSQRQ